MKLKDTIGLMQSDNGNEPYRYFYINILQIIAQDVYKARKMCYHISIGNLSQHNGGRND
ncbi:hypothetical protein [uncultured Ruminococcus sp.]|uniref:hypothetical protein n=1 Tax=uncultured Ruminococcus sp. TaxID=165186 RepID=UPI00260A2B6A|nr:hypothetical protein [uncultured Ruminococcus sp.]